MAISNNSTGIYCITIGPKFYIGSCINFEKRMKEHTRKLGYGTHVNAYVQSSFDKYQTFDAEIMEFCSPSNLEAREQFYIDQWFDNDDCLNLRPHARTMLGFKHSDASREKIRQIRTGTTSSDETKAKLSIVHSGRKHTDATKQKMSDAKMGTVVSLDTRVKQSSRKRKLSDSQIVEITSRCLNGESQTSVAKDFGVSQSNVSFIVNSKYLYLEAI